MDFVWLRGLIIRIHFTHAERDVCLVLSLVFILDVNLFPSFGRGDRGVEGWSSQATQRRHCTYQPIKGEWGKKLTAKVGRETKLIREPSDLQTRPSNAIESE